MTTDRMMKSYHNPNDIKVFRDPFNKVETSARQAIRKSSGVNIGAWMLTVAAIVIGAWAGANFDRAVQIAGFADTGIEQLRFHDVAPAAGHKAQHVPEIVFLAAGDGNYYADMEIAGVMTTVRVDPNARNSVISASDRQAIVPSAHTINDIVVVPRIEFASIELINAAMLISSNSSDFTLIGADLLSQMGKVDITPTQISIRPI